MNPQKLTELLSAVQDARAAGDMQVLSESLIALRTALMASDVLSETSQQVLAAVVNPTNIGVILRSQDAFNFICTAVRDIRRNSLDRLAYRRASAKSVGKSISPMIISQLSRVGLDVEFDNDRRI